MTVQKIVLGITAFAVLVAIGLIRPATSSADSKDILKQGLLGAGVGAISAEASGGKAGKGALVGAGTNVIGGALLDALSGSGQQQQAAPAAPAPAPRLW